MSYLKFETNAPIEWFLADFRRQLAAIFDEAVPGWSAQPYGLLSKYWLTLDTDRDAFNLMGYLLMMLSVLKSKLIKKSEQRLLEKIKQLLTNSHEKQLEEILFELEVGFSLAQQEAVEAIAIEPLTLTEGISNAARPRSPDYAVRLNDGDFFVEVTVSSNQTLIDWDNYMSIISQWIEKELFHEVAKKTIILKFPIATELKSLIQDKRKFQPLLTNIRIEDQGHYTLAVGNKQAIVSWELAQPTTIQLYASDEGSLSFGKPAVSTIRVSINELEAEQMSDLVFKSLDTSLRNKKEQFTDLSEQAPILLAMRVNHYRINSLNALGLIHRRIWSKPPELGYNKFSGVCMIVPMILPGFRVLATAEDPQLTTSLNPRAAYLFSPTFKTIFKISSNKEKENRISGTKIIRLSCFD